MATRETLNSEWASPEQVKVNFEKGQGLRLGQSFLTDDERFMFVSVVKQGTPPRIGVLERKDVSEPFGKFWYLDISDAKGPLPLYGMPRYSAATKELFVSSRFLFRSDEIAKQRNSDIWVLKGFVFGD
jgi:hypothetical protein